MPGKVPPDDLITHVFGRTGAADETVIQGPADGEDAAAIGWPGDGDVLVVSSDPISLAASDVGTIGVHIACNDVAASGADPHWLTTVILLPPGGGNDLESITTDLDAAARDVGATIVGGHTEFVDALERPLLSLTAFGGTERFVPTGGAEPGDRVLVTKGAGIEGTAILAADFGDELEVGSDVRARAESFLEELSVVPESRVVREYATSMHDPTEGGVVAGLLEVARASNVGLEIERESIPVRAETWTFCDAAGVDPLRIFGSGALLAAVPEEVLEDAVAALAAAGIDAAEIGAVTEGTGELVLDGAPVREPVEDELYPLWDARDNL